MSYYIGQKKCRMHIDQFVISDKHIMVELKQKSLMSRVEKSMQNSSYGHQRPFIKCFTFKAKLVNRLLMLNIDI